MYDPKDDPDLPPDLGEPTDQPEPPDGGSQDPEDALLARGFAARASTFAPATVAERMAFLQRQAANPTQSWLALCQSLQRQSAGAPAIYSSAWTQWLGLDDEDKVVGGDPNDAPVGAMLFSKGSSPWGHVWQAAHPFKNDVPGSWSNDLIESGRVDKVQRDAPMEKWRHRYLGYGLSISNLDLKFPTPKPKEDKPYRAIARAITQMEKALETARADKDRSDVEFIRKEIRRLKIKYKEMRHS